MTLLFIGTTELLLIGGVALLFFGGKKLPEMMRGLGQGVKQFKEGLKDITNLDEEQPENDEKPKDPEKTEAVVPDPKVKKPTEQDSKPNDDGRKQ